MNFTSNKMVRAGACWMALSFAVVPGVALAQNAPADQNQTSDGAWRRVGDPTPSDPSFSAGDPQNNPDPQYSRDAQNPDARYQDPNQGLGPGPSPNYTVPPRLTMPTGAFVTVRINQPLSSDRNQAGDAFSASLVQPLIVDGVIVAERGQTIGGRVVEAQKAGRVEGTSRLKIQLTDLTLVDGQVVPVQSQLISRNGPTSVGRDAGAIAGTTAVGAAIGAGVGWGTGAAIGAGAGAVVGTIGVLLTRGHPTIIGPESVLTFRVEAPVTIATDRAPQAFRFVAANDYNRAPGLQSRPGGPPPPPGSPYGAPGYVAGYPGYGYGYPGYPYYGYPYGYPYYGPGFGVYIGPGFYGRGFYGRGFRR
jgi:hypothetical protein